MQGRRLIEELLPLVSRNATIVAIEEHQEGYAVTVAGTTAVLAHCRLPREQVEAAAFTPAARWRIAAVLKRCADDVVAGVPDGRG